MKNQKALITGIEGFTGPYIKRVLESLDFDVYGLSHKPAHDRKTFSANLLEFESLQTVIQDIQPDIVIHLAAISFVAHGDIADIYNSNIVGTRNLLRALAEVKLPPSSVILASTANVYGQVEGGVLDEQSLYRPANDYAVSKLAMEQMSALWSESLPITIVRPFNYTGVGQSERFLLPKIVSHFASGAREIELGNVDVYRDFSDVRTIADMYGKLVQHEIVGGAFNLCSGSVYSLTAVLDMMADIAGYAIDVTVNPAFVRDNEIKYLKGSNDKLLRAVGAVESYSLSETLQWMYQSAISCQAK